jgi:asparagine synthase (glutamine-hydrolysing)
MAARLDRRGPDDQGSWVDPEAGIALGFRRLAIVDLSAEGHQPMRSSSGRFVMAFNGEIYNYTELRRDLAADGAPRFRGHSDTEVFLAAIERWGLLEALRRSVGMFAIALWDRTTRTLHLARDRMGEKPLYFGRAGSAFIFGSELKALRAHPGFDGTIDTGALALYLRLGYIPEPFSIHRGITKLPPASTVAIATDPSLRVGAPTAFWSVTSVAEEGQSAPFDGSEREAIDELESHLGRAVSGQMVADVPLGALLSGGLDSSSIVALMQARSTRPVRTFTIGFDQAGYDEARHAAAVARYLGTEHTELYLTPEAALELIPVLPETFDEPFADPSALPTLLVARLARQHVTVGLSGDGGDELLGGYPWHAATPRLWGRTRRLRPTRGTGARTESINQAESVPRRSRASHLLERVPLHGQRLRRLADLVSNADAPEPFHLILRSRWLEPSALIQGAPREPLAETGWGGRCPALDPTSRLMLADSRTYLPGDILTKVDRCSMRVGLECRAPFLDHRVVEFAWRLPIAMKVRDGRGKWILRRLVARHLPDSLVERPKQGFSVPLAEWLREHLRDWAEDLLSEQALRHTGYLRPAAVRRSWKALLAGGDPEAERIWSVLVLQSWSRQALSARGVADAGALVPTPRPHGAASPSLGREPSSMRFATAEIPSADTVRSTGETTFRNRSEP